MERVKGGCFLLIGKRFKKNEKMLDFSLKRPYNLKSRQKITKSYYDVRVFEFYSKTPNFYIIPQ